MTMKKVYILILALMISLSACSSSGLLSRKDYLSMKDVDIRGIFIKYTPLGSEEKIVQKFIIEDLQKRYRIHRWKEIFRDRPDLYEKSVKEGSFEDGEYYYSVNLASHGWARNCFLAGNYLMAYWHFNSAGYLIKLRVVDDWEGV